jgi:hypothetical protein
MVPAAAKPSEELAKKPLTVEQALKQRLENTAERVCEVVRAIALEMGDDRFVELAEQALTRRALTAESRKKRLREKPRRLTIYPSQTLGAAINALAKERQVDRNDLICLLLAERLGVSE